MAIVWKAREKARQNTEAGKMDTDIEDANQILEMISLS
jgi:hypothetical protein